MIDHNLIIAKGASMRKHLKRVKENRGSDVHVFLEDINKQDIVSFNLHMALQNCIDIAAHIISEEGIGVPGSINEMFYILEENDFLPASITEKMVRAVGFRNLLVHEYGKIDLKQVYEIAHDYIGDLDEYLFCVFSKLGISDKYS